MHLKNFFLFLFSALSVSVVMAQQTTIRGTVRDATTGETLIGANVVAGEGVGAVTDYEGNYSFKVDKGTYTLRASYIGYEPVEKQIEATGKTLVVNFKLETITLTEVKVVADVARDRETPVAFSNISPKQIQEELASQDLPMVLNTTPGVYATQQGGGDGDARITIRGFSQRNVAVMIDGIPVNDMENGWVYWSNWFGLDVVTRSMQVQRGLGASKVAIPSIGGTINILTEGIESNRGAEIKQEVGNNGFLRTSLGLTTGRMENGWGVTLAGSFKRGNGWVDQAYTKGWFYYAKIQKQIGKHTISASAMGAPQEHGQRSYKRSIEVYDKAFAEDLGIETDSNITERGLRYNQHWGYLERWDLAENGDTIHADREIVNEQINYYHKPQFSLRDFWAVNNKLFISNVAYLSIGNGGGTAVTPSVGAGDLTENGQVDFQKFYNSTFGPFAIDVLYSDTERKSGRIIRSSVNNHFWYGLLSTANYAVNDRISVSGGIDLRSYKGSHYREVYDLLGGDYYVNIENKNSNNPVKRVGDKIDYFNDGLVRWGGAFGMLEYKAGNWSAFINLSGAYSGYKRIDYFRKKQVTVGDTTLNVGYNYVNGEAIPDSIVYDGNLYTPNSEGLDYNQTDWKWIPGFTVKTGANYNINEHQNVFMNIGYLSRSPRFANVYDLNNKPFLEIENEITKAVEFGYGIKKPKYAFNLNGYYTRWENKPVDNGVTVEDTVTGEILTANVNGIDALHMGVEADFAYNIAKNLTIEALASYGDWTYQSSEKARYYHPTTQRFLGEFEFDAEGVHVGDAAQTQYSGMIRYEPIKGLYFKPRITHFRRYFADFNPFDLKGENAGRESWMVPAYTLLDVHAGYRFRVKNVSLNLRGSLLNALDTKYISDARNNDPYILNASSGFDATSAGVFFGQGRRFNISLLIKI